MKDMTKNEMEFVLAIFKNPDRQYNANSLSKILKISSMGALKIAKKLEKEGLISHKKLGKAKFYSINFVNDYSRDYIVFLLKMEAEHNVPYIKMWVNELKSKIKNADIIILFGSVLKKGNMANDIDVLLVTNEKDFPKLKKEVEKITLLNNKELHPVYQSIKDLENNIKRNDPVILNVIKGVVVLGAEKLIKLVKK